MEHGAPAAASDRARAGAPSLVVQTSFLGDMVLTTPLLTELARRGPVDVVATPANAALITTHPAVRECVVYDKRGTDRGTVGLFRLARRLRARGYGSAYLAQGSTRSALLAALAGIPRRIGFRASAGRWLYTERRDYRDDLHHTERLWRLAGAHATPTADQLRPTLVPAPADHAAAAALLGRGAGARPLAVLAPGSVWATKRWPGYARLAARLAPRVRFAIIGGGGDATLAQEIMAAVGATTGSVPVVNATGRLSLLASTALLQRAALLVTNDSAPQHLASAAGTPTVAIFGPTVPGFGFGPLAPRSVTVGRDALPCRPCDRHGPPACPLGHWRCMREVTVADVAAAARRILDPSHPTST